MVLPIGSRYRRKDVAEDGRYDADDRYGTRCRLDIIRQKQTKSKETKQWAIGIGRYDVDGIDDTGAVQGPEGKNDKKDEGSHTYMNNSTQALVCRAVKEIDAG